MMDNLRSQDLDKLYAASSAYIGKQYKNENESTRALCDWIKECSGEGAPESLLDAGCGDGAILVSMRKRFPNAKLMGFDGAEAMVAYAKKHLPPDIHVKKGDMMNIAAVTSEKSDVVYTVHTLSLFSNFEPVLLQLMGAAKRFVFINSLFSKHNLDMYATTHEPGGSATPWNIFSIQRFATFAKENGAKNVEFVPFEMPFELPDRNEGEGSYTEKLADGRFLTFTGPLFLPWYFARVDL